MIDSITIILALAMSIIGAISVTVSLTMTLMTIIMITVTIVVTIMISDDSSNIACYDSDNNLGGNDVQSIVARWS